MRAVTLSDAKVRQVLNRNFVCGWKNIKGKKKYSGKSNAHPPTTGAYQVNNCAGHHNVQMFFLSKDGRVLHCLPGYWSPRHFLHEMEFAIKLARVYYSKRLSTSERNDKYLDLHLQHAGSHSASLQRSSQPQNFDKGVIKKTTDDVERTKGFKKGLKTLDQVIHERMAERPFVPFKKFDVASYIKLGRKQYKYKIRD